MNLNNLHCIDLDLPGQPGFRKFMSSWLYRDEHYTLLVDPGPLSTIPFLCRELRRLGVTRLDHVLLTHIHIDHAGGTGALLREFPEATVICHPEGIRHMVNPAKLWEGSKQVLGAPLADAYGEIVAIPADRIGYAEHLEGTGVRTFLTPGHAQHHCCFLLDDLLFAGELAGVRAEVPTGLFMRPATPPRFFLEVAIDSLDGMIALSPRFLVFAHYGLVDRAVEHLQIARKQLLLWVKGVAVTAAIPEPHREAAIVTWLYQHDELYHTGDLLPPDIQVRERYFLRNTLRGMIEYVAALSPEEREALATAGA